MKKVKVVRRKNNDCCTEFGEAQDTSSLHKNDLVVTHLTLR